MLKCFLILSSFLLSWASPGQYFDFAARDAAKLSKRTLLVILQEEDPAMLKKWKTNPERTEKYKYYIAQSNSLLKELVPSFWFSQAVFKTRSEALQLSQSSKEYYCLEFSSLRVEDLPELYKLPLNKSNCQQHREALYRLKEYGYFELRMIEKLKTESFYTFYLPTSIPERTDFALAIQQMARVLWNKSQDPQFGQKEIDRTLEAQNKVLHKRTLLADSQRVDKQNKKFKYIDSCYKDSYALVSLAEQGEALIQKSAGKACLFIVPFKDAVNRGSTFEGTTGGGLSEYEKQFYFMQIIIDTQTGEWLYYDVLEENKVSTKDWKRFFRFSEDKFSIPIKPVTPKYR